MRGLKESECGQIGVKRMAGICGWTIDPPAESEYAVDPVVEETMIPSAWMLVSGTLSQ